MFVNSHRLLKSVRLRPLMEERKRKEVLVVSFFYNRKTNLPDPNHNLRVFAMDLLCKEETEPK